MAILGTKLLCAGIYHARTEETQGRKASRKPRQQHQTSGFTGDNLSHFGNQSLRHTPLLQ
jgi:hypothetical protein